MWDLPLRWESLVIYLSYLLITIWDWMESLRWEIHQKGTGQRGGSRGEIPGRDLSPGSGISLRDFERPQGLIPTPENSEVFQRG